MDKAAVVLIPLLNLLQLFLPLIGLAGLGFFAFKKSMDFWVEAQANEWMLIIRNGELKQKGIGLCAWTFPGDQTVKFPSLIN